MTAEDTNQANKASPPPGEPAAGGEVPPKPSDVPPVLRGIASPTKLARRLRWAVPLIASPRNFEVTAKEKDDVWERLHDHLSGQINAVTIVFGTLVTYCLVALAGPDANLFGEGAQLQLPALSVVVSFELFVYVGPGVLIALASYLQFLLAQLDQVPPGKSNPLPFVFNLGSGLARLATTVVAYWLAPAVLLVFTWKALPLQAAARGVFVLFCVSMIAAILSQALAISLRADARRWRVRNMALLLVGLIAGIWWFSVHADRTLRLSGADLKEKNLAHEPLRNADLRRAKLQKADLRYADLSHADLRGANLDGADLRRAVLDKAQIDDTTIMSAHWRNVVLLANNENGATLDLSWSDLTDADLRGVNFKGVTLVGADLRRADLRGVDLTGVDARLGDFRGCESDKGQTWRGAPVMDGALSATKAAAGDWRPVTCLRSRRAGCLYPPENLQPSPGDVPRPVFGAGSAASWEIRRFPYGDSTAVELRANNAKSLCLDSTGVVPAKDKEIRPYLHICKDNENQMWTITRVDDQWDHSKHWLKIDSHTTGQCLDSDPPSNHEPHFFDCAAPEQLSQQWSIELPDKVQ